MLPVAELEEKLTEAVPLEIVFPLVSVKDVAVPVVVVAVVSVVLDELPLPELEPPFPEPPGVPFVPLEEPLLLLDEELELESLFPFEHENAPKIKASDKTIPATFTKDFFISPSKSE